MLGDLYSFIGRQRGHHDLLPSLVLPVSSLTFTPSAKEELRSQPRFCLLFSVQFGLSVALHSTNPSVAKRASQHHSRSGPEIGQLYDYDVHRHNYDERHHRSDISRLTKSKALTVTP